MPVGRRELVTLDDGLRYSLVPSKYSERRGVNVARNRVRIPVLTPQSASHGDIIIAELSANQKIDLSTLTWHFNCTTTTTPGTGSCVPPRYTSCLIQQLQVDIGGVTVFNLDNYHQLYQIMADWQGGLFQGGRGTIGEWANNYTAAQASTVLTNVPLMVKGFLGFLGNGKILDTGLTGAIRITIRVAPQSAMVWSNATTASTLTLDKMFLSYDVVTLDDGIYDQMIQQRLASGGVLPLAFTNYMSYFGSSGSVDQLTNRIGVSVQSLDYIHHTLVPNNYNTVSVTGANALNNGTATHFRKGDDQNKTNGCQFQVGSTMVPSFRQANPLEMYSMTVDALGLTADIITQPNSNFKNNSATGAQSNDTLSSVYTGNYFLFSARLCANAPSEYEFGQRLMSGINCRGAQVLVSATTYAASGSATVFPLTFLQFTSVLNIGASRQLEYIM